MDYEQLIEDNSNLKKAISTSQHVIERLKSTLSQLKSLSYPNCR